MPVSAETLSLLMQKGLVGEDLLEIVRSIDLDGGPQESSRHNRNRRYYEKHRDSLREKRLNQSSESVLKATETTESVLKATESVLNDAAAPPPRAPATLVETNLNSKTELLPKNPPSGGKKGEVQANEQPFAKPKKRSDRGYRLPPDWSPTPADMQLAVEMLGDAIAQDELVNFRDYWPSVAGQKGLKTSWDGTWRNRVRDVARRLPAVRAPPPRPDPRKSAMQIAAEINAAEAERAERSQHSEPEIIPPDPAGPTAFRGSGAHGERARVGGAGLFDFGGGGPDLRPTSRFAR